ncbi:hypothetical protein AMTR_s00056p00188580 [Amborella trichopoda]|uniref:Clathrin interactor EPSIN 1 n=1 Tax=Amborella trichopoda TaxID=13333 RepID=U5CZ22_AMBTC|nr:hypothetical protein AMTR_s00056p00188580 [Amborella trichopoda]
MWSQNTPPTHEGPAIPAELPSKLNWWCVCCGCGGFSCGGGGGGAASHNNMDLLGDSFGDDLIDAAPSETVTKSSNVATEVDLFDNTSFVAAFPPTEASKATQSQVDVDFFSQPASTAAFPSNIDFFSSFNENTAPSMETKSVETQLPTSKPRSSLDPFATIPLDPLDSGDTFGDFTSHADQAPSESLRNSTNKGPNPNTNTAPNTKPPPKNDNFKVKSGIWADSLSRGLIDLNITAPKKTSLADIGIVGLSDGYEQKIESQRAPISYMGRAMGSGSGLAISGFGSTTMDQQFGSFK